MYIYGVSLVAQMVRNLPTMHETPVQSLRGEDPWRRGSSFLAWRMPWTVEKQPDNMETNECGCVSTKFYSPTATVCEPI